MTKLYVCPCCNGQGVLHDAHGYDEQLLPLGTAKAVTVQGGDAIVVPR